MNDLITKKHVFAHPIQKVWDAISREEEISSWFIQADFKAEAGYQYTFKATEEHGCTEITGQVLQAEPYTLVYTWIVRNTKVVTTVKWVLEEVEEGTRLYLEHSGISGYEGETAVTMFNSYSKGWDNCITELSTYLKLAVDAR